MPTVYTNPSGSYKNPFLQFFHDHPFLGIIIIPMLWDFPAKIFQAGVRTAKHGDMSLGSAPFTLSAEDDLPTGVGGNADASFSLFGAISGEAATKNQLNTQVRSGGVPDMGNQFPPRGALYRDTSHLNSAKAGPYAWNIPMYKDTRHLTPTKPTPGAYSEAWLERKGATTISAHEPRPSLNAQADQRLVDMVQDGVVFRGIRRSL